MPFKVPARNPGLCVTCSYGLCTELANGHQHTFCTTSGRAIRVHNPVVRCTEHNPRYQDDERRMREIAWVVRTDNSGTITGFRPPKKRDD